MHSPRRRIRTAVAIGLVLALIALVEWRTGDDLAFAHLYYLPIVLAGFAFRGWGALSFSLAAALISDQLTRRHQVRMAFGSSAHTSLAQTAAYCLTGLTTSWLSTAYRQHLSRLLALHEISASINSTLRVTETLELVARHSATLTGVPLAYLYLRNREDETLTVAAAYGDRSASHKDFVISAKNSTLASLMQHEGPQWFNDPRRLPGGGLPAPIAAGATALMAAPLTVRGDPIGLLVVVSTNRRKFKRVDAEGLRILAEAAAIAIDEAILYERTERLAITDSLTGLNNQRYFRQHFELELGRAQRRQGILSLVIFDLDNFKRVNDTYGHMTGDSVLREVSRVARTMVRRTDLLARIGGEEFAILLPESNKTDATVVAEKLRLAIMETAFEATDGQELRLTISAGVASYPFDGSELEDIFEAADKAMYRAKAAGRNRVYPELAREAAYQIAS